MAGHGTPKADCTTGRQRAKKLRRRSPATDVIRRGCLAAEPQAKPQMLALWGTLRFAPGTQFDGEGVDVAICRLSPPDGNVLQSVKVESVLNGGYVRAGFVEE